MGRLRRVTHLAEFGTSMALRLASLSSPKHLVKRFFDHHYTGPVGIRQKMGQKNGQSPQAKPSMVALKVSSLKLGIARCEPVLSEPRATGQREAQCLLQEGELTEPISRKRSRLCRASTAPSNQTLLTSPAIYATHPSGIVAGKPVFLKF